MEDVNSAPETQSKRICRLWMYLDTVYFAENWKHCSKIIFKCVNSAVRSIFNECFVKKKVCGSCE